VHRASFPSKSFPLNSLLIFGLVLIFFFPDFANPSQRG
jgi:hypothetical protein